MTARNTDRPHTVSALMKWIVRHAVWPILRFKGHDVQSHSIEPWVVHGRRTLQR